MHFEVSRVQVELRRNTATVTFSRGRLTDRESVLVRMKFDPPGDQNESQMEALAIAQAKALLIEAASQG